RPDRPDATGRVFTTPEMVAAERDVIAQMQAGRGRYPALVPPAVQHELTDRVARLSPSQRAAVEAILRSRDRVMGLQGTAGAGKTTALAIVRNVAERGRYRVEGLAPTSRAAQQLEEAGILTARLDEILRQRDPALKAVVEALARGEVESALARLTEAGRVHEIADSEARLAAVARAYARYPKQTLVISPDNASRVD